MYDHHLLYAHQVYAVFQMCNTKKKEYLAISGVKYP